MYVDFGIIQKISENLFPDEKIKRVLSASIQKIRRLNKFGPQLQFSMRDRISIQDKTVVPVGL